jgi:RecA-family ATPase
VVPGIIPEGLTILAGRPKIGKSWMALDLALGISADQKVLGGLKVEQGDVLYCCLEDNPRRLQRRVTKLLGYFGGEWPERLTLATRWRRLDQGGVDDIEAWAETVPNPRLVLLDTLAGVRPGRNGTDTLYDSDYAALRDVHRFANDRGMGGMALHHTRKMEADDPVDTISGSLGLAGCADTCLILARSSSGTTLYVRGRDIEEGEKAVMFGAENCRWSLLGEAADVHRTENQKRILSALEKATGPIDAASIASVAELSRGIVDTTLHRLAEKGEVVQVSRGRWAYPGRPYATPKQGN